MFSLQGHNSIPDFFKSNIALIIDMYTSKKYDACNDCMVTIASKDKIYHRIAYINNVGIYIDDTDTLYKYERYRFIGIIPINKLTRIGKFEFMHDISMQYDVNSTIYAYIMHKRHKYFIEKSLEDIFRG